MLVGVSGVDSRNLTSASRIRRRSEVGHYFLTSTDPKLPNKWRAEVHSSARFGQHRKMNNKQFWLKYRAPNRPFWAVLAALALIALWFMATIQATGADCVHGARS